MKVTGVPLEVIGLSASNTTGRDAPKAGLSLSEGKREACRCEETKVCRSQGKLHKTPAHLCNEHLPIRERPRLVLVPIMWDQKNSLVCKHKTEHSQSKIVSTPGPKTWPVHLVSCPSKTENLLQTFADSSSDIHSPEGVRNLAHKRNASPWKSTESSEPQWTLRTLRTHIRTGVGWTPLEGQGTRVSLRSRSGYRSSSRTERRSPSMALKPYHSQSCETNVHEQFPCFCRHYCMSTPGDKPLPHRYVPLPPITDVPKLPPPHPLLPNQGQPPSQASTLPTCNPCNTSACLFVTRRQHQDWHLWSDRMNCWMRDGLLVRREFLVPDLLTDALPETSSMPVMLSTATMVSDRASMVGKGPVRDVRKDATKPDAKDDTATATAAGRGGLPSAGAAPKARYSNYVFPPSVEFRPTSTFLPGLRYLKETLRVPLPPTEGEKELLQMLSHKVLPSPEERTRERSDRISSRGKLPDQVTAQPKSSGMKTVLMDPNVLPSLPPPKKTTEYKDAQSKEWYSKERHSGGILSPGFHSPRGRKREMSNAAPGRSASCAFDEDDIDSPFPSPMRMWCRPATIHRKEDVTLGPTGEGLHHEMDSTGEHILPSPNEDEKSMEAGDEDLSFPFPRSPGKMTRSPRKKYAKVTKRRGRKRKAKNKSGDEGPENTVHVEQSPRQAKLFQQPERNLFPMSIQTLSLPYLSVIKKQSTIPELTIEDESITEPLNLRYLGVPSLDLSEVVADYRSPLAPMTYGARLREGKKLLPPNERSLREPEKESPREHGCPRTRDEFEKKKRPIHVKAKHRKRKRGGHRRHMAPKDAAKTGHIPDLHESSSETDASSSNSVTSTHSCPSRIEFFRAVSGPEVKEERNVGRAARPHSAPDVFLYAFHRARSAMLGNKIKRKRLRVSSSRWLVVRGRRVRLISRSGNLPLEYADQGHDALSILDGLSDFDGIIPPPTSRSSGEEGPSSVEWVTVLNTRSLPTTQLEVDPSLMDCHELREWHSEFMHIDHLGTDPFSLCDLSPTAEAFQDELMPRNVNIKKIRYGKLQKADKKDKESKDRKGLRKGGTCVLHLPCGRRPFKVDGGPKATAGDGWPRKQEGRRQETKFKKTFGVRHRLQRFQD